MSPNGSDIWSFHRSVWVVAATQLQITAFARCVGTGRPSAPAIRKHLPDWTPSFADRFLTMPRGVSCMASNTMDSGLRHATWWSWLDRRFHPISALRIPCWFRFPSTRTADENVDTTKAPNWPSIGAGSSIFRFWMTRWFALSIPRPKLDWTRIKDDRISNRHFKWDGPFVQIARSFLSTMY